MVGNLCQGSLSSPAPLLSATSGLQPVNISPLSFNDSISPHFTVLSTKYGTPPLECVPRRGKQNFKGWFKYCGFAANPLQYIQTSLHIREGIGFRTTSTCPPLPNPPVAQVSSMKWSRNAVLHTAFYLHVTCTILLDTLNHLLVGYTTQYNVNTMEIVVNIM